MSQDHLASTTERPAIQFPAVVRPLVTIVVVVYGGWPWLREALDHLVQRTPPCYELVVVDNASPDGTAERLAAETTGATLVFNEDNVGFGPAANQGALHAVARHLLFLNSDAFVQPGWLPPLLEVLERDPGVAAVAPCLLDPDGRLQEAGGVVAGDGFAGQLGLGADADRPEYGFRRRVDFASGAVLLVRRHDFQAIGGFDPAYEMGYFEDVDLCLTLWDRGRAVVYEPRSQVVHLRGASGTEEMAQRYAVANHSVLVGRWSDELGWRSSLARVDDHPHRLLAARDARALDRVMFVGERLPTIGNLARDANAARLVHDVAERWPSARLTSVALDPAGAGQSSPELLSRGVEVAYGEDWTTWLAARRLHYSAVVFFGADAFRRFEEPLARTQPQALKVLVLDEGLSQADLVAVDACDIVVAATEAQRRLVVEASPSTQTVVIPPVVVAPIDPAGFFERAGVVRLDTDGADLSKLQRARAAIAPVSADTGLSWGLLDAIAAGLPFVTNRAGADLLGLGRLSSAVVADEPDAMADLVATLDSDAERWADVQDELLGMGWASSMGAARRQALVELMAELGAAPPEGMPFRD